MTTTRSTLNAATLVPGLRGIYMNDYSMYPDEYMAVMNVLTSDRSFEEKMQIIAFGATQTKAEGTGINYEDLSDRAPIRVTHVAKALGYRVTHEAMKDWQYAAPREGAKALARSVKQSRNLVGVAPLNNAFNAAFPTLDGKALCATDHPLVGAGTFSNKLTAVLSPTSMKAALTIFDNFVDDKGFPVVIAARWLAVPTALRWVAKEILASPQVPYKMDNEINVLQNELTSIMLHYLLSTTAWFVIANKADHSMEFYDREKPSFEGADDFETGDAKFKAYHRESSIAWHFRGVVGSDGTGT